MQFKRASLAAALGLGSVVALGVSVNAQSSASAAPCDYSGRHEISIKDLPAGSNAVACKAVGRIITAGGAGVTIPEPGMVAGTSALLASGGDSDFQVHVAKDGTISYPTMPTESGGTGATVSVAASDPGECSDSAYSKNDLKAFETYDWFIGDGGLPGALTVTQAQSAFSAAISNITNGDNNCGLGDAVPFGNAYWGTTTQESGMDGSGNCTSPDNASVWDAGTVTPGVVARTCWWATESLPGAPNPLKEADVQFNTTTYNFTDTGGSPSCSNQYDIRSVGTHEAGHVFGLGHVGAGHSNLTMYTNSFVCRTIARSLGRGDMLGLASIY